MESKRRKQQERKLQRVAYQRQQRYRRATHELYEEALSQAPHEIYHLSEDIWVEIMSYLPTVHMLRMKFVCRLFHFLLTNPAQCFIDESLVFGYGWSYVVERYIRSKKKRKSPFAKMNRHWFSVISEEQLELYQSILFRRIDFGRVHRPFVHNNRDFWLVQQRYYSEVRKKQKRKEEEEEEELSIGNCNSGETGPKQEALFDACLSDRAHSVVTFELLMNLIISHGSHLEELVLNGCDAVNDLLLKIIVDYCPNLKRLELRSCRNLTEDAVLCVSLHKVNHNLQIVS